VLWCQTPNNKYSAVIRLARCSYRKSVPWVLVGGGIRSYTASE
jgi:hypothetical protein